MTTRRYLLVLMLPQLLLACAPYSTRTALADVTGGTFSDVGDDTVARFFHRASVLNDGRVMVTGGMGLTIFPSPALFSRNQVSFFDPGANTFSAMFTPTGGGGAVSPVLITARSGHTQTTLLDGRVLISGGRSGASGMNPGAPVDSVEVFDPETGVISVAAPMGAARADHTATMLSDGRVVVAGGSTWQVFDPTDDSWSTPPPALQRTRSAHAAVLLAAFPVPGQERVLLIGGAGSGPATMELLDPDTGDASLLTSTLAIGVDDLGAAALPDGTVLIVGGQNVTTGDTVGQTYRLDVAADELTPLDAPPNLDAGISDHQVIALGRYVLIFGGEQQAGGTDTILDDALLFDANVNEWTWSGSMNNLHDDFAAALLHDGRVLLISGGVPLLGQEAPSASAETFAPTDGSPADVNCDGVVNVVDLLAVLGAWGECAAPCPPECPEDTDESCAVDVLDLLAVLGAWG